MPKYHKDGTLPTNGEVFVFGSNLSGNHGAGAALVARRNLGAQLKRGVDPTGNCYAIPTKDYYLWVMPLEDIEPYVNVFLHYAREVTEKEFFITRVGCGLAGYKDRDIAPMFATAPPNCSLPIQWKPYVQRQPNSLVSISNSLVVP